VDLRSDVERREAQIGLIDLPFPIENSGVVVPERYLGLTTPLRQREHHHPGIG
jgi:hypothetical protein